MSGRSHTTAIRLPAQPTVLIGRAAEIDGACRRIDRPEVRLLTLVGPGGVGKTRLAARALASAAVWVSVRHTRLALPPLVWGP
jgi:flagellar biosynthesis GTPase FlhF